MGKMTRKVVAAFVKDERVVAVCDDGTVWRLDEGTEPEWKDIGPRIPGTT